MNDYVKAGALVIYVLAAIGSFVMLPTTVTSALQMIALVLLALHALELVFMFKAVRKYPGPLVDSIALTLLFGFLHWMPLNKNA